MPKPKAPPSDAKIKHTVDLTGHDIDVIGAAFDALVKLPNGGIHAARQLLPTLDKLERARKQTGK
jgi:hypothetical protein